MLPAQVDAGHRLVLQPRVLLGGGAGLGFALHLGHPLPVHLLDIAEFGDVAVLPVVALVVDAAQEHGVVWGQLVVQAQGQALAHPLQVVLPDLHLRRVGLRGVVVVGPLGLHVVGAEVVVEVAAGDDHAQGVTGEAFPVDQAAVVGRLARQEVVAGPQGAADAAFVGSGAGHQVHAAADGVGVHIGGHGLAHLHGLDHVGGDEVELDGAGFGLRRGDAFPVNRHGIQLRRGTAYVGEAGFPLVVLHVDPGHALEGVADVLVGKAADLVGGDHVGDVDGRLLLRQRPCLPAHLTDDGDFGQLYAGLQLHSYLLALSVRHDEVALRGGESDVGHPQAVGSGGQVHEVEVAVPVGNGEPFVIDENRRAGERQVRLVQHAAVDLGVDAGAIQ